MKEKLMELPVEELKAMLFKNISQINEFENDSPVKIININSKSNKRKPFSKLSKLINI